MCFNDAIVLKLDGSGPLYRQVYRAFREDILTGILVPGQRVPSSRALSELLKVSRNTAVLAYEQLLAEGYLEALIGGAGTVVAANLPLGSAANFVKPSDARPREAGRGRTRLALAGARILKATRHGRKKLEIPQFSWEVTASRIPYDFHAGRPAFEDLPHALWCRLLGARARNASLRDLDYGPPEGRWELREAIANRLRRMRGIDTKPERIVIVHGTQQALDLIIRVLVNPGDRVLIEEPHYTGARYAIEAAGGKLFPARVDHDGIQVPRASRKQNSIRLAYVTPSHQFPTGVVLPVARRLELLNWASRADAFVIEDDYDSEYRYDGPPLQALAGIDQTGRVIYVGTFSKILFPALRLGYLVLPESLVEPITAAKAIGDTGTATLEQLTLADFISKGYFDRHLRRTNARNGARRNALVSAIRKEFGDRAEICGANTGLHLLVWIRGKGGGRINDAVHKVEMAGVGLYSVDSFYLRPPRRTGLVLGYASLNERQIREGIRRLADALI